MTSAGNARDRPPSRVHTMFAVEFSPDAIHAAQAILLAAIAAWVAVRTRQISASVRRAELRADREKERCDELERRVKELEGGDGCCGESGERT